MKLSPALSLFLPVGIVSASACASIVSTSGSCTQIVAPPNALPGALSAFNAWAWDEQTGISLAAMPVDLSTNPSNSFGPVPGFLTALADSHFIHYDGVPGTVIFGSVTFSDPIIGVQYNDPNLDLSDAIVSTGTIYPTFMPLRGFNNWTGADYIDINGNVLTFQLTSLGSPNDLEQIRVFTRAIPAPGAVSLAALGALLAARRRRG